MFYKDSLLLETNLIKESELQHHSSYWVLSEENSPFADKIIERHLSGGAIDLVIYYNAQWDNASLVEYHREHYKGIPYHIQELLAPRAIKTTMVSEGAITGYIINNYKLDWGKTAEHSYDESLKLREHKSFIYGEDNVTIIGENVFDTSTWVLTKVKY